MIAGGCGALRSLRRIPWLTLKNGTGCDFNTFKRVGAFWGFNMLVDEALAFEFSLNPLKELRTHAFWHVLNVECGSTNLAATASYINPFGLTVGILHKKLVADNLLCLFAEQLQL